VISLASAAALAAAPPANGNQPGGQGQEFGSSSPIALLVILLLLIATALLIYSMSKHIKKVPRSFDPEEAARLDAEAAAEKAETEGGTPVAIATTEGRSQP
jgi:Na+-transporting methylmalonyl-CoA/oxaloacetate decarboxylase gamma subunit